MVLFLFIIMLLDVGPDGGKVSRLKLITGLAGCVSVGILIILLLQLFGTGIGDNTSWPSIEKSPSCKWRFLAFRHIR